MPNPLIVGFDGLGEIIGAIFVCELCNDRDRLVGFGFGRYLGDIDDNLGMEDFLLDAFVEVIGYSPDDTVPKTCVSSKVLIFVVKSKIKSRTMKLTTAQRSEIISEPA